MKTIITKGKPENGKLNNLIQTHGKTVDKKENKKTSLAQIWGDNGLSVYGTMDKKEYVSSLNEMNKVDLYAHAIDHGLRPVADRRRIEKELTKMFDVHVNQFSVPTQELKAKGEIKISKGVKDILAEGR